MKFFEKINELGEKLQKRSSDLVKNIQTPLEEKRGVAEAEYLRKKAEISAQIDELNIFKQIDILNEKITALDEWRQFVATPKIIENLTNIFTIATEIKDTLYPRIVTAQEEAQVSLDLAMEISSNAEDIVTRLKNIGNQISTDASALGRASSLVMKTVQEEFINVKDAFLEFGEALKDAGLVVVDEAVDVGKELVSSYKEIKIPLGRVKFYVEKLANPNLIDLLGTFNNVYHAFGHMVFLTYEGQNAVMWEVIEHFEKLSREFYELGDSLWDFGDTLYHSARKLAQEVNASIEAIAEKILMFLDAFETLSTNLASTFIA